MAEAYDRVAPLARQVFVLTEERQTRLIRELLPEIPPDGMIVEPAARGTTNALGLAALTLLERDPEAVIVSTAADHVIGGLPAFKQAVRSAAIVAAHSMETPVKNFSSGMYVRLGFAVAVHLDPEILLVDEVLAVGDANFQRKWFQHLHGLRAGGCTIVLVSHDMDAVARFCERTLWLDRGRVMEDGASDRVIQSYLDAVAAGASLGRATPTVATPDGGPLLTITSVRLFDSERREVREAESGRPLRIEIGYRALGTLEGLDLSVTVFRDDGVRCVDAPLHGITAREGRGTFVLDFPSFNLQGGNYDATIAYTTLRDDGSTSSRTGFTASRSATTRAPAAWCGWTTHGVCAPKRTWPRRRRDGRPARRDTGMLRNCSPDHRTL